MHFTWPTIYLFTLYDKFEFKILIIIYIIERYLISKIPSTVIWYWFQHDKTSFLIIFTYLNLFQGFMKCYVVVLSYSTCLIIIIILIICSSPSSRNSIFETDWSFTLLVYHILCSLTVSYWSICRWIISCGQCIFLTIEFEALCKRIIPWPLS